MQHALLLFAYEFIYFTMLVPEAAMISLITATSALEAEQPRRLPIRLAA